MLICSTFVTKSHGVTSSNSGVTCPNDTLNRISRAIFTSVIIFLFYSSLSRIFTSTCSSYCKMFEIVSQASFKLYPLTLFDMGGAWWPPTCFWPLCRNALEEESATWWLLILMYGASKKVLFGSLGYPVLPWRRVCQGVLEIFWSYCSICFLITKF